jgi:TP901 family phage tail tape measure protein
VHPIMITVGANVGGALAAFKALSAGAAGAAAKVGSLGARGAKGIASIGPATTAATRSVAAYGQKSEQHLNKVAKASTGVGLALVAVSLVAIKTSADFEQAMSNVAATGVEARVALGDLERAALTAGKTTQYSAVEAAGGIEDMIKAGVSAKDVYGKGLQGALSLAAAGTLDLRKAAELAATAMAQFELSGEDMPHIADLLAAGAGKAQGTVEQLGFALKYVGPVANSMNISIEQTVGVLAELANVGILGEQAGTSFRGMLLALTSPSKVARDEMDRLGISMYDSEKNFIGMDGAAQQLHENMVGLTNAERDYSFGRIFGNAQVTAARTLYEGGAAAVAEWTAKVNDAGFAEKAASIRLDNLKGDLTKMVNQFKTAMIGAGGGAQGPLREMVQGVTGVIKAFNEMDAATQSGVLSMALKIGGLLLAFGGMVKLITVLGGVRKAMIGIGAAGGSITKGGAALRAFGVAGLIAAGAMLAIEASGNWIDSMSGDIPKLEDLANTLRGMGLDAAEASSQFDALFAGIRTKSDIAGGTKALTGFADALDMVNSKSTVGGGAGFASKQVEGVQKFLETVGFAKGATSQFNERMVEVDGALTHLRATGQQAAQEGAFTKIAAQMTTAGWSSQRIVESFPELRQQLIEQAEAVGVSNISWEDMVAWMGGKVPAAVQTATDASIAGTKAILDQTEAYKQAELAAQALVDVGVRSAENNTKLAGSLFEVGNIMKNNVSAHSAYAAAVDGADKAITKSNLNLSANHKRLSDNTKAQRDNIEQLNGLASSGEAWVESLIAQGAGAKEAAAATKLVRGQFVAAAKDAGLTGAEARKLADMYGLVPKEVTTTINAFVDAMQIIQVNDFVTQLNNIDDKKVSAHIMATYKRDGAKAAMDELEAINRLRAYPHILTKSDAKKVSEDAKHFMDSIKDGKPKIKTESNAKKVADDARRFLKSIKNVDPKVLTKADLRAARAAAAYLKGIPDEDVNLTVHKTTLYSDNKGGQGTHPGGRGSTSGATGGLLSGGDIVRRSGGGPVWGAGTATSDSIPAWLSNGEFVVRAAAVKAIGAAKLFALNAMGHARGGFASAQGFAAGGVAAVPEYDRGAIWWLIRQLKTPLTDLIKATKDVAAAQKKVDAAKKDTEKAKRTRDHAKPGKARDKAEENYTKILEKQTTATDKLKEAQDALKTQQDALADSARQLAETSREPYGPQEGADAQDWLALMKQGAGDVAAFTAKIQSLRKAGLNETAIQQIIGMGALAGGELAGQIAGSGMSMVDALNAANKKLQDAADQLGFTGATGQGRYASGGPVWGAGTGTSDSINARLSHGEYVVNALATAANRPALDQMNFGRQVLDVRPVQSFRYGGMARAPMIDHAALAQAVRAGMAGMHMSATLHGDTVTVQIDRAIGGFVGQFGKANA